jgi:hypothetical protein
VIACRLKPQHFPHLIVTTASTAPLGNYFNDINKLILKQHLLKSTQSITTSTIMGGETIETAKPKSSYPVHSAHPVGQWIPNLYKDRIAQFYSGGQYEGNNLRA